MYEIYADGKQLWSPAKEAEGYDIISPHLSMKLNTADRLTFTLPPTSPMYNQLQRMKSTINVLRDGATIWSGRLLETKMGFDRCVDCTCESVMGYLMDTIIPPFAVRGNVVDVVRFFITSHNARAGAEKKIVVRNVTVTDSNDYVYRWKDTYNTTWSLLMGLQESYGGCFITETVGGNTYLDYLEQLPEGTQIIQYGDNLLNLEMQTSAADVFTCLIPLGAMPEGGQSEADRLALPEIWVENAPAVEKYGKIFAVRTYDDITQVKNLRSRAVEELTAGVLAKSSITVGAVDKSLTGEAEPLKVGQRHRIISVPHGIDTYLDLTAAEIPLKQPGAETYTLGKTSGTLTQELAKSARKNNNTIKGAD